MRLFARPLKKSRTKKNRRPINSAFHGNVGIQDLGGQALLANIVVRGDTLLYDLGTYVNPEGKIWLMGCQVARGELGQSYLQNMANHTGRTVFGFTGDVWHFLGAVISWGRKIYAEPCKKK